MGVFKKLRRAVNKNLKKVQKGISKVGGKIGDEFDDIMDEAGPELGAVVGFMIGGPMGSYVLGAALGAGIGSLAGGRSVEESLKNAALAGGIVYGGQALMAGSAGGSAAAAGKTAGAAGSSAAGSSAAAGGSNLAAAAAQTGTVGPTIANAQAANLAAGYTAQGALPGTLAASVGSGSQALMAADTAAKGLTAMEMLGLGSTALSVAGATGMFGGPEETSLDDVLPPETRPGESYARGYRTNVGDFDLSDEEQRKQYVEGLLADRERAFARNDAVRAGGMGGQYESVFDRNPSLGTNTSLEQLYGIPATTAADGMYKNLSDEYFMSNPQPPTSGGMLVGPGTGKSDSIMAGIYDNMGNYEGPARLSDGEFVVTADAIKGLGDGDPQIGAARMYQMMASMERMA